METLLALLVGVLFAAGVFLMLERALFRFVLGLILVSNAVNLLIIAAGRVASRTAPLVPDGAAAPAGAVANPVPQALVLTAIVIGFGLVAFTLALLARAWESLGVAEADAPDDGDDDEDEDDAVPAPEPELRRPAAAPAHTLQEVAA
jgi:multicomponent Na+:H+ antiporter subunit C